ncbi:MAG TPA: transcriptional repressor, partial [Limnochordia bacterium]|nr:transcriptional repressor [Limnochordia bacterium]
LTPDDVCRLAEAEGAGIGQATIYRTLELCRTAGLLYRFDGPGGRHLYELNAHEPKLHHHLICLGCGRIEHCRDELALGIQQVLERELGFVLTDHALHLFGYCRSCAAGAGAPPAPGRDLTPEAAERVAAERLERLGYRLTEQRRAVMAALAARPGRHLLPDEVCEAATGERSLGIATVYRTLELLEKLGLVDSIEDAWGHKRYEPAAGSLRAHHHHLICSRCGRIFEYRGNLIGCVAVRLVDSGFALAQRSLRLVGRCRSCRGQDPGGAPNQA